MDPLQPDELVLALLIRYDPAPGSAGTATGRCSRMSSASRPALRRQCVFRRRRAALGLSPDRRGSPWVGAPHRHDRGDPPVDHLPQPIAEGPSARDARV